MSARSPNAFHLARLRAKVKPFRLHFFPRLRSTNDHAAALRRRGELFAPAMVLASRQTAGRGRGENAWFSAPGCLTITFILPIEDHLSPHQLPLIAGLAVRAAAAELAGTDRIGLKWPNDVVHAGQKLAGLLCERIHKADLIGVGLNVNLDPARAPAALRRRITSLAAIAGAPFDMTDTLISVTRHLSRMLIRRYEHSFAGFLREYDHHHALRGQRLTIIAPASAPPITGQCEGIDSTGRLLIRDGPTLRRIVAGHVVL